MPRYAIEVQPFERGLQLAAHLLGGADVDTAHIRDVYGVSPATAKRDLRAIEGTLREVVAIERIVGPGGKVTLRRAKP